MKLAHIIPIALCAMAVSLACAPAPSHSSSGGGALVQAAPAPQQAQRTAGSYTRENRDLEEDDVDDDDDDTPAARRRAREQAAAAAQRRAAAADDDSADDGSSAQPLQLRLALSHAYGSSAFTPRGEVLLNFNPARGAKAISFSADHSGAKSALSQAAKQGQLYRIRFKQEGQKDEDAIMAAVPAFLFHVDPYGSLVSVSYRTPVSECAPAEVSAALSGADRFTLLPKAKISFGKPGEKAKLHVRPGFDAASQAAHAGIGADPAPAAAAAAPAAAHTADGKPAPPEKGFFAKYWMYIVPLGIFMVMQAVVAPPEQPSGGGGAGGGGAARAQ